MGDDGCAWGALKQPRGVIPRLLRLTVSLWTPSLARLEPGGVFLEVRFSSVFPGPCDKRTVWRQLPRQYGRPNGREGRRYFWLFTRTPVEWGTFGR